ncbi:TetR/AcrR family transcriptional regulator [Phytohabitans kaempferiae]|uniref:TetR/AcrR family transcriptional regulator n=1 Tax=Phytohabitans kaempferiae TaxID=1620943 RepID=A0ABV6M5S0_9ACTN
MTGELGRRERKKKQTREALVSAANRLFAERGFDKVTAAEIAEAADVSSRTFFLHFDTKEDVLLGDARLNTDAGIAAIDARGPADSPRMTLARAASAMIAAAPSEEAPSWLGARARLIFASEQVRARLMQRLLAGQEELAEALRRSYPDLDSLEARALVGSVVGGATFAVGSVVVTVLDEGGDDDRVRDAIRLALQIATQQDAPPGS